ncbi:MAG TPA: hypothetical protein VHZ24_05510 [Pirellulales bacterium]|jgi:hypothetical protein|nr:hypothetical protein [Pirellulales bacterium]
MNRSRAMFDALIFAALAITVVPAQAAPKESTDTPGAQPSIVFLAAVDDTRTAPAEMKRVLAREIFRQAVQVIARDEFGLSTRDAALGESQPEGDGVVALRIDVRFSDNWPRGIAIARSRAGEWETALEQSFGPAPAATDGYLPPVKAATALADSLAKVLEDAGCVRRAAATSAQPSVSPDVALHLGQCRIASQFGAIQQLEALQLSAATPELSIALIRGYANLGLLTEFLFSPAHKVFKARALLRAERLCEAAPDDGAVLWSRGYALALAGLPSEALESIEQADKRQEKASGDATGTTRPGWVTTAQRFCRFEIEKLDPDSADDDVKELTRLLRFVAIDRCNFSTATIDAALDLLPKLPECYLVHDALCRCGGVSLLHEATVAAPQLLAASGNQRVAEIPGLPDNVARVAMRGGPLKALASELDLAATQTAPTAEPSWSVLANLLRELTFVHLWRRFDFEVHGLGWSGDRFIQQALPMVADHRYATFFETRHSQRDDRMAAVNRL